MMACKDCAHPVNDNQPCPFCQSVEQIELCITCRSETITPPGAQYPFCQSCAFDKGVLQL